ncbi:MAG TPA: glycosyltransferase [Burkholderiaceae bacterium]
MGDGASIHVRRLAEALHADGMTVELASFAAAPMPGIPTHRLGSRPADQDRRYLLALPRLAHILRRRRPAVVNAHYLTSYGVMSALALRLARIGAPLIQTTWGDDLLVTPRHSKMHRTLARFALADAAAATGDSLDLEAAAKSLVPDLRWLRFVFGPAASLLGAPVAHESVILSARQLIPEMRVDQIIRAFQLAAGTSLADWKLVVAGKGPERPALEALAKGNGQIEFAGELSQPKLHDLMLHASVGVSIPESDATSATLLESLAAGMVPIVSDLPANREWVDEAVGEIVSLSPSVEELAAAMRRAAMRQVPVDLLRSRVADATFETQVDRFSGLVRAIAQAPGRESQSS